MSDPGGDLMRRLDKIEGAVEAEMQPLAVEIEQSAKQHAENEKWQRDTGSAGASVTAYSISEGDYDHNFGDPDWQQARLVGSLKYRWNGPYNYTPVQRSLSIEDGPGIVLTMFVAYAEDIGGDLVMQETAEAYADRFIAVNARGINEALRG